MFWVKTLSLAFGVFVAAILIACVVAVGLRFISEGLAVATISVSPLVGIGAAVGFVKDKCARRRAGGEVLSETGNTN